MFFYIAEKHAKNCRVSESPCHCILYVSSSVEVNINLYFHIISSIQQLQTETCAEYKTK